MKSLYGSSRGMSLAGVLGLLMLSSGFAQAGTHADAHGEALRNAHELKVAASSRFCNTTKAAEDFWFTNTDPGYTSKWFDTVTEAENYVDPYGRSVYWLVRTARSASNDSFVSGINDLWAVEFYISRTAPCSLVVTGEH